MRKKVKTWTYITNSSGDEKEFLQEFGCCWHSIWKQSFERQSFTNKKSVQKKEKAALNKF